MSSSVFAASAVDRLAASLRSAVRGGLRLSLLCCVGLLGLSQAVNADIRRIDFELTGRVLDFTTKQPIEGAYVIASYFEPYPGFGSAGARCVKARGMYTGKDGRFHFPVEKRDGYSPLSVDAIKSDYQYAPSEPVKPEKWRKQNASAYSDRILYLTAQDPAKPNFHFGVGFETCETAETREGAAASVVFLKISLKELIKYGALKQNIDGCRDMIELFESLTSRPK